MSRSPFSITVTLFDPYGNLETNYTGTVTFASSDATALLPFDYTFTLDDKGTHNFGVVFFTLGNQTLIIADKATGTSGSVTITVTGPPAPPPAGSHRPGSSDFLPVQSAASDGQTALLDSFFASMDDKSAELKQDRWWPTKWSARFQQEPVTRGWSAGALPYITADFGTPRGSDSIN